MANEFDSLSKAYAQSDDPQLSVPSATSISEAAQSIPQGQRIEVEAASPGEAAPSQEGPISTSLEAKRDLRAEIQGFLDEQSAVAMKEADDLRRTEVQSSVVAASKTSPDLAAKAHELSQQTGIPVSVVLRNMDLVEKSVKPQSPDYDGLVKNFPATSGFLSEPSRAMLVTDDIEGLQKLEQNVKNLQSKNRVVDLLSAGSYKAASSLSKIPASLAQTALVLENQTIGRLLEANAQQVMPGYQRPETQRVPEEWFYNPAAREFDRLAEAKSAQYPEISADVIQMIQDGDLEGAKTALISQLLYTSPTSIGLLIAGAAGAGIPALAVAGMSQGAEAQQEALEAGVSPEAQVAYGTVSGVAEAAFESLPLGVFNKWSNSLSKSVGRETAKRFIGDVVKTVVGQTIVGGTEEAATAYAQAWAAYATGVDPEMTFSSATRQALNSFVVGGGMGLGMAGPGTVIAGTQRAARAKVMQIARQQLSKAENASAAYVAIGEDYNKTKVSQRSGEMGQVFIQEVSDNYGIKEVQIPAEAFVSYFQKKGESPEKVAADLGVTQNLDEAVESGAPIRIPFAPWISKMAGTEDYAALKDDVKFPINGNEDVLTVNEAKAETESITRDMEVEAGAAVEEGAPIKLDLRDDDGIWVETLKTQERAERYEGELTERGLEAQERINEAGDKASSRDILALEDASKGAERVRKLKKDLPSVPETRTEAQRIGDAVRQVENQLRAAKIDKKYAPLFRGIAVMAIRVGKNPIEFLNQIGLRVQRTKASDAIDTGPRSIPEGYAQDGPVQITVIDSVPETRKEALRSLHHGKVTNIHSGFRISLNAETVRKFGNTIKDSQVERAFVSNAKSLTENAIYVGPDTLEPKTQRIKAVHIFYSPMQIGDESYLVKFKTRETLGGQHLYHGIAEITRLGTPSQGEGTEAGGLGGEQVGGGASYTPPSIIPTVPAQHTTTIQNVLRQVNDIRVTQEKTYFQGDSKLPSGQILIGNREIHINLFENADFSTIIHEAGHLYSELLKRLSKDSVGIKADADILANWAGAKNLESLTEDQQEDIAKGFELYFREGKAPNKDLGGVFQRFKTWLTEIYMDVKELDVELTDEVRGVFDRIMATEQEIGIAEIESGYIPMGRDIGLSKAQATRLDRAREDAQVEARDRLASRLVKDELRKQDKAYKARKREVETKVRAELEDTQVYIAVSLLQTGKYPDGTVPPDGTPVLKIDRTNLDPAKVNAIEAKFGRRVFNKTKGLTPDVLAPSLGFNSGTDLIETLTAIHALDVEVALRTDEIMQREYPDLMREPAELHQEALEYVHNDSQEKLYRAELEILAENHKASLKDAIRTVAKRAPSTQVVKDQAEEIISRQKIRNIKPNFYLRAEQKANKEAGELLAKGDIAGAFDAKRRALLNYHLFKAATQVQDRIKKDMPKFQKMHRKDEVLAKSRDMDLVNAARAILAEYGLGRKTEQTPREYLEKIKEYGGQDQYNGVMAHVLPSLEGAANFEEVSFDKYAAMSDAVQSIWELSRDVKQIDIEGKKLDAELVVEELMATIDDGLPVREKADFNKTVRDNEKTKMRLLGAKAALTRVEHWFRAVDGGKRGAFTRNIFDPVAQGTTKYRTVKNTVINQFRSIMEDHAKNITFEEIDARSELGFVFKNKTELLMALLHTGNSSNKSKLLRGRGWGDLNPDGTLDTSRWDNLVSRMIREGVLTKADYDFVQKVWNLMESLKPDAQIAHRKIYGYSFNEITAETIRTPFGDYKGGYIPAKVDLYENVDAEIRAEREAFNENNNSWQFPTTGRGFAKSRVDSYAAPLSLDFSLLGGHIDGVLRFTYIEPAVRDVARLMQRKDVRKKIAEVDPNIVKNAITPWLQRAATQRVVDPSKTGDMVWFDNFATYARQSAAVSLMFANVVNTLEQFTGIFVAASQVSPRYLTQAIGSYITNYKQVTMDVNSRSGFMSTLQAANIYESQEAINRIITDPGVFSSFVSFMNRHTYFMQAATQNVVNTVTWQGAYNQSIESGMSEVDAVREADSAVRRTQGTMNPEDVSAFESGSASKRLFTQFAGYFNMIANLNAANILEVQREVGLKNGAGKLFYVYMMTMAIPAILSNLLRKASSGKFDENDDDSYMDDMMSVLFGSQFRYALAIVPWVGQAVNAVANRFDDNMYNDRMSVSPVVSLIESSAAGLKAAYDVFTGEDLSKRDVKDILTLIGFASRTPVHAIGRPVGYLMDVESGNAEPTGPIDFLRGIVTGRP